MSQNQPPYPHAGQPGASPNPPPPPYPDRGQPGAYPYPPPPKKSHTVRNVLLGIGLVMVLMIGGCIALIGGAANEIDKAITEGETESGSRANPVTIRSGEAFEVRGFDYAAGWTLGTDGLGDLVVKKLKVTNNRDDSDSAFIEIKLWRGSEVLASVDCSTDPIEVGTTVSLSCTSIDAKPKSYDKITVNDSF